MITIFRRFKQGLLTENKFSKYFIYAIREIILVMIGILLALQVSNWIQKRNQLKQEHKLLLFLKADFVASKERLLFTMKAQKRRFIISR
tara:strand:+ start:707 stop:973 length:267 start_codon:yes stop_codon:yes gene_type:complete